jgi:hypothetical protein
MHATAHGRSPAVARVCSTSGSGLRRDCNGAPTYLAAGRALEDADAIPVLEHADIVVVTPPSGSQGGEGDGEDKEYMAQLGSQRVDLSGEAGGEDEGGAPVGAREGRWRRPLNLRREEGCSCSMRDGSEEGEAR